MKSIISLVGLRGSGKTTVGRLLAERLNWKFLDSDLEVERAAGIEINEYFRNNKLKEFRDAEAAAIADAHKLSDIIIATGGGCVEREETRAALKTGFCVWLTAKPEILFGRLQNAPRPALTGLPPMREIEFIMEKRRLFYEETAKLTVSTDALTPEEACDAIQRAWEKI